MLLQELELTDYTEGEEEALVTLAEYLSFWGCDASGDRAPREPGDGYAFYNYGSEGDSLTYLQERLLPAVKRQLLDATMSDLDRDNFVEVEEYITAKIAALKDGVEVAPVTLESETFQNENGVTITYGAVRKAMKDEMFDMRLGASDYKAFAAAVNQGIDARLQACFCPERGDKANGRNIIISVESMPVLIRRLFEADDDSNSLAEGIMMTLGFKDNGKWAERE